MRPLVLIFAYIVVVTLPLLLSAVVGVPPRPFFQEIASGLGILAFAMILVEFVLSGRFRQISSGVGMDVTMRLHQVMSRTALAFALLHPFLYQGSPSGGPRPWDATRQLSVTSDFSALWSGIAAFLILPSLVAMAIGRTQIDQKYEVWRLLHGLAALALAGLLLHHTLAAGRYGGHPVMIWVWSVLTAVSVGSLLYVYLVAPLRQRARPWKVDAVTRLTPKQWQVSLSPVGHEGFAFEAGQFAWLNIGHGPFSLHENPFSIASAPAERPGMAFLIKELGDFTRTIGDVKPGATAYLDGPYGSLSIDGCDESGIALIAGGVGIAPMLSILRQLRASGDPRPVRIVYGNRMESQIACRDLLDAEDVVNVLSEPPEGWQGATGLVDGALIDSEFSQKAIDGWVFVICGPAIMMDVVEDHLIARGTPSHRILSERFDYD